MKESRKDIYEVITSRFIEKLKQGTVPWQKPWISSVQNIVSRKPYRGINTLLLGSSDFSSPYWMSFKQASDLGGSVKKGEKSTPVVYYKFFEKRDDAGNAVYRDNGAPVRIPFIRWSNVFNLDQTEGVKPPELSVSQTGPQGTRAIDRAAAIVRDADLCPIYHTGFAALYSPGDDVIRMPSPQTFHSLEKYYHVLYHEMTHASGHISRLGREGIVDVKGFGSERYSKEELVGEIGASFLSNEAGILDAVQFENSAAYLNHWIEKLGNDPKLLVSAASQAQGSTDFILGIEQKESLQESHLSPEGMPLAWAKENGIDTHVPGLSQRDNDGDGLSNLQEWKQGTNPIQRHSNSRRPGIRL